MSQERTFPQKFRNGLVYPESFLHRFYLLIVYSLTPLIKRELFSSSFCCGNKFVSPKNIFMLVGTPYPIAYNVFCLTHDLNDLSYFIWVFLSR